MAEGIWLCYALIRVGRAAHTAESRRTLFVDIRRVSHLESSSPEERSTGHCTENRDMNTSDTSALAERLLGAPTSLHLESRTTGRSGAQSYLVRAGACRYMLKIDAPGRSLERWQTTVAIQRAAAERGVTPQVVAKKLLTLRQCEYRQLYVIILSSSTMSTSPARP